MAASYSGVRKEAYCQSAQASPEETNVSGEDWGAGERGGGKYDPKRRQEILK